jgi:hypothetical protein
VTDATDLIVILASLHEHFSGAEPYLSLPIPSSPTVSYVYDGNPERGVNRLLLSYVDNTIDTCASAAVNISGCGHVRVVSQDHLRHIMLLRRP